MVLCRDIKIFNCLFMRLKMRTHRWSLGFYQVLFSSNKNIDSLIAHSCGRRKTFTPCSKSTLKLLRNSHKILDFCHFMLDSGPQGWENLYISIYFLKITMITAMEVIEIAIGGIEKHR